MSDGKAGAASVLGAGLGGAAVGAASSGASSRLKGGGEDAAGGAVVLALLHTILAAVHEEGWEGTQDQGQRTAAGREGTAVSKGPTAVAAVANVLDPGKLSPLEDSEYLSAAPLPLPDRIQSTGPAAAGSNGMGRVSLGSRVLSGVGAGWGFGKAGGTAAGAASPGVGETSSSNAGETMLPERSAGSGSTRGSLSWVQQQLRRGLQLGGGGGLPASPPGALGLPGSLAAGAASAGGGSLGAPGSGASGALQGLASAPDLLQPVADVGPMQAAPSAVPGSGGYCSRGSSTPAALAAAEWPESLAQQLLICGATRLQREPITGLAAAGDGGGGGPPLVCCVGYDGLLRVLQLPQLEAYRWGRRGIFTGREEQLLSLGGGGKAKCASHGCQG